MRRSRISLAAFLMLAFTLGAGCAHQEQARLSGPDATVMASAKGGGTTSAAAPEAAAPKKPTPAARIRGGQSLYDDVFGDEEQAPPIQVADPLEPINRGVFWVNDKLYLYLLDPLGRAYKAAVQDEFREGVSNFFYNLGMPVRLVSNVLQGRIEQAATEVGRFFINSTLGVLGTGDAAEEAFGIKKPKPEDLGQAMGSWGFEPGPYLVWPFIGPSNLRDSVGMVGGYFLDPLDYIVGEWEWRFGLIVYEVFNDYSFRVGDYEKAKKAAIDPYISMRNFYYELRRRQIAE